MHVDTQNERLTYTDLREANVARQAAWCPDQLPDLSFRGNELAGETGEVCNVIKKLERERLGWRGSRDTVEHLAEELADVVICADLAAQSAGIDLQAAVIAKFNATSEKVGLPHRLAAAPSSPATKGVRVKPLEWHLDGNGEYQGLNPFGLSYLVWQQGGVWRTNAYGGTFADAAGAQSACQNAHEKLIRSALEER